MQTTYEAVKDYFPESLQYLMTVISVRSVLVLVKKRGGTRINIPSTAKAGHWLAELIGMDDLEKLTRAYGYTVLDIPLCKRFTTLARDLDILDDSRAGLSASKLAAKHQMSERGIMGVLKRIRGKEKQPCFKEIRDIMTAIK